jgi:tetratricopeptide (TPR) repeat protein
MERGANKLDSPHPYDICQVVSKSERPITTDEATELHDQGNEQFRQGQFLPATESYHRAFVADPKNWAVRINEAVSFAKAKKYDRAAAILKSVRETCTDPKFIAQAYINEGDCIINEAQAHGERALADQVKRKAYELYGSAYAMDCSSIIPLYHYWFGALLIGETGERVSLARKIESHPEYNRLTLESREYFEEIQHSPSLNLETLIMRWKTLIIVAVVILVVLDASIQLWDISQSDGLFKNVIASSGVINGKG